MIAVAVLLVLLVEHGLLLGWYVHRHEHTIGALQNDLDKLARRVKKQGQDLDAVTEVEAVIERSRARANGTHLRQVPKG